MCLTRCGNFKIKLLDKWKTTLRGDPKCGHGKQAIIIALVTKMNFICLLTVTKLISITYYVFLLKNYFF